MANEKSSATIQIQATIAIIILAATLGFVVPFDIGAAYFAKSSFNEASYSNTIGVNSTCGKGIIGIANSRVILTIAVETSSIIRIERNIQT